jgi:hypothetical protein
MSEEEEEITLETSAEDVEITLGTSGEDVELVTCRACHIQRGTREAFTSCAIIPG